MKCALGSCPRLTEEEPRTPSDLVDRILGVAAHQIRKGKGETEGD